MAKAVKKAPMERYNLGTLMKQGSAKAGKGVVQTGELTTLMRNGPTVKRTPTPTGSLARLMRQG